jgi:predicted amidophosphoribosyltransferase
MDRHANEDDLIRRLMADNIEWLLNVDLGSEIYGCADCMAYWVDLTTCWLCGEHGIRINPKVT